MPPHWRDLDEHCRSRHWWQDDDERMLTAMTVLVSLAVVLPVAALVAALVRLVRSGGSTVPAPPAHEWTSPEQAPERPYRDLSRVA